MATLGSLSLMLSASSGSMEKGIRRAKASLKSFGSGIAKLTSAVSTYGAAVVAAGAVAAVYFIKKQFDVIDSLSKLSDKIGVSTEALASFQLAAKLTGVGFTAVEKGAERLARLLGDARRGNETATKSFIDLGLSLEMIEKGSIEEVFGAIGDELKGTVDPALRASKAYGVFGRQALDMMNFLTLGSEAMKKNGVEAKKLGLTFSRELGANVERANDAMTRAISGVEGIFRQLAPKIASYITLIVEKFNAWVMAGEGVPGMATKIADVFKSVMRSILTTVEVAVLNAEKAFLKMQTSFAFRALSGFDGEALSAARTELEEVNGILMQITLTGGTWANSLDLALITMEKANAAAVKAREAARLLGEEKNKQAAAELKLSNALLAMEQKLDALESERIQKNAAATAANFKAMIARGQKMVTSFSRDMMQLALDQVRTSVSTVNISGGFSAAAAGRNDSSSRTDLSILKESQQQTNLLSQIKSLLNGGVPAG